MILAICMGLIGHLCAAFLTVLAGYGILHIIGLYDGVLVVIFLIMGACALVRGILRYAEQACNHFIAFKLLAMIRDKVFQALRRLCPAKLEGKDKGDLIAVITSDIELLEVFYAHTISKCDSIALYDNYVRLYRAFSLDSWRDCTACLYNGRYCSSCDDFPCQRRERHAVSKGLR